MFKLIFTAVLLFICDYAQAAKSNRIYFVREADEPVVIGTKPHSGSGIVMRDPNLGGNSTPVEVPAKKLTAKKSAHVVKDSPKKGTRLAFKPMKIGATVRMPRVEFGRVALPVGIREEMPSTDFVAKSLEELP